MPFRDARTAGLWLAVRRHTLIAAIHAAADDGLHPIVWRMNDALWPLWDHRRDTPKTWIRSGELALHAVRHSPDHAAEPRVLTSLGAALLAAGRHVAAHATFHHAHDLATRHGDDLMRAQALHDQGRPCRHAGEPALAHRILTHALPARTRAEDPRGPALTRTELGLTLLDRDNPTSAVEQLTQARAELLPLDPMAAAWTLAHLGTATARTGQPDTGDQLLRQAETEFTTLHHIHARGTCAAQRALIAAHRGRTRTALNHIDRALRLHGPFFFLKSPPPPLPPPSPLRRWRPMCIRDRLTTDRFEKSLRTVVNSTVFRSSGQDLTTTGTYTEMASRFTEPVLLTLAILAIRARVKR
ncbi:tetratricopeptide repeat protein [Streptomyces specialis]|uniref:hypothetical protein n=1 Tax=Streptomyces specialis TaxID=498367 RepID=UPI001F3D12CB|nr:hypothetical protein [Streptomyces specialis]